VRDEINVLLKALDVGRQAIFDYALFFGMAAFAAWGGMISYVRSQRAKKAALKFGEAMLESFSAAFVGVLIGVLVMSFTDNTLVAFAASGWAGHEGTRKIFRIINSWLASRIQK
jgi:hypothetical protein